MTETLTLTRDQVREVDRRAVEELGIPGIVLMENAAVNAAALIRDTIQRRLGRSRAQATVAIVCGGGNNGGDGYAIARHLHNRGLSVQLFPAKAIESLQGDAAINASICANMDLSLTRVDDTALIDDAARAWAHVDLIVDAMLGTGFAGEVRDPLASIINTLDKLDTPIVAIDTPSGLDCQTGEPASTTIHARETITFVAHKIGFTNNAAQSHTGAIHVADIGVPPEVIDRVRQGA